MKIFLWRKQRQLPAWVTETTAVRANLQRLDSPNHPSWVIVSGQRVTIGDIVTVDVGAIAQGTIEGADPAHRLPLVRIGSGHHVGQLVRLTPGQVMRREGR